MATMFLKSVSGDKQVELRGDMVAGRNEDCDLVLSQGHPSRRHARINVADDGVWLEDLGSTNGTYVNDRKVEGSVKLEAGDRVRFDAEEFDVTSPDLPAAPEPDANATVLRAPPPPPAPAGVPPPESVAPAPPPAAPPEQPAAKEPAAPAAEAAGPQPRQNVGGGGTRRPGAWADPDQVKQGGTVLLDPEQLQALMGSSPSPEPLAAADAPHLVVMTGAQAGATLKLAAGAQANVWDVGRDAGRDIRFDEDGVSGFHAKIVNEGARWKVIDQMSANGTLVNEKRGTISFLSSGDRIRFGPVECVFQLPAGSQGGRAARSRGASARRSPWGIIAAVVVVAAAVLVYFLFAG